MSNNSTKNKIESYLLRQMTEAERNAFEAEVLIDEKLAQQLEQQQFEHKIMENLVEQDLIKDMKNWQAEIKTSSIPDQNPLPKTSIFSQWFLPSILIGLLIFSIVYLLYVRNNNSDKEITDPEKENIENINPQDHNSKEIAKDTTKKIQLPPKEELKNERNNQKNNKKIVQKPPSVIEKPKPPNYIALADSYYQPNLFKAERVRQINKNLLDQVNSSLFFLDSLLLSMSNYESLNSLKTDNLKALDSLLNLNYTFAERSLNDILAKENSNLDLHYKLGLVYYNQKKFSEAIPHFKVITENKAIYIDIEKAQWLLCLSLLQTQKIEESIEILKLLKNDPEHSANSDAVNLLGAMAGD